MQDEALLVGTDGLWGAAVGSENREVSRLAQKLLLKLECTVMESRGAAAEVAAAGEGGALQSESSGGQGSQLISRVKAGLAAARDASQPGAVSAYVDVLQLFVDKYRGNASHRAHGRGVRGAPLELKVDHTVLPGVHAHTTAAAVYAQVAVLRESPDPDDMGADDDIDGVSICVLRQLKGGELPRDSLLTLAELGIRSGCVFEALEMRDETEESNITTPKPCPGDALAADASWLELFISLLASEELPGKVGESVFGLLDSVSTFSATLDRINASGFELDLSSGAGSTEFVKATYALQVLASQLRPASGRPISAAEEEMAEGDDGLSAWRANSQLVASDLVILVAFALRLPERVGGLVREDVPDGGAIGFVAACALPLTMDILGGCVEATCGSTSDGVLGQLDDAGLGSLKRALLGADGSGVALLEAVTSLMTAGDSLATAAAAQVEVEGGGGASTQSAQDRGRRLGAAVQRGADVIVLLLQRSPPLLSQFLASGELTAVAGLLFESPNAGVRHGVRNALKEIAAASSAAGEAVFELCTTQWESGLPTEIDPSQFFALLSDLNGTTPAVRDPLLALFIDYLMAVPSATGRIDADDKQHSLVHALELVAALLQSTAADLAAAAPEGGESGGIPPTLAKSLARLSQVRNDDEFCIQNETFCIKNETLCIKNEEFCIKNDESQRIFTRFVFTIPEDPTDDGLPICQAAASRAAACTVLDALCKIDPALQQRLVHELSAFVKVTDPPQSYTGFMDFNADMTDDYSTPYKMRNSTGRAGITNQGMTCYMNASLQQIFHIPEARHAALNSISGVRFQITNSADVLMRNPQTETAPPALEISINGAPLTKEGVGITYNATTELSKPMAPGIFRISFKIPARGLEFSMEGIELARSGNYLYELVGNTQETFQLLQKPKSSELLPQLRRCFYFLEEGNAAAYDSSKFCDACESMPMFAEWTDNRVRQQCCAGEYFLALMDTLSEGIKGLPCADELKRVGTTWETTKFCHKCKQAYPDQTEWNSVNPLTTFTENSKLGSLADCMGLPTASECFDGKGDNPLLSPWCKCCGDKDEDERTVTTKWQAIQTPPAVLTMHLKRFNQVWDDWGGMRQEKKNHRIEFPLRFDLAPYMAENVRAKHVARIQKEMADAAAAAAAGGDEDGAEAEASPAVDGAALKGEAVAATPEEDEAEAEGAEAAGTGDEAAESGSEGVAPVWYTFLGAIIHSGVAGGGHYVSIVKQPDGQFVLFDDNEAIPFDPENIPDYCFGGEAEEGSGGRGGDAARERTKNAYMLLYRREDVAVTEGLAAVAAAAVAGKPEAEEPEPEPEVEVEVVAPPVVDSDELGVGAMKEMEEELQMENLRLLRRERMYQPAVIKLFYNICREYVSQMERAKAEDDLWRLEYDGVPTSVEEEDRASRPFEAGALAASVMELATMCFLKIVIRAKHGHAQIKPWLTDVLQKLIEVSPRQAACWLLQYIGTEQGLDYSVWSFLRWQKMVPSDAKIGFCNVILQAQAAAEGTDEYVVDLLSALYIHARRLMIDLSLSLSLYIHAGD